MITIYCCTNFNKEISSAEIHVGDAIRYEIAAGPLHEICLIEGLDIRNLDLETLVKN